MGPMGQEPKRGASQRVARLRRGLGNGFCECWEATSQTQPHAGGCPYAETDHIVLFPVLLSTIVFHLLPSTMDFHIQWGYDASHRNKFRF